MRLYTTCLLKWIELIENKEVRRKHAEIYFKEEKLNYIS